jgi:hypothetical protein
MFRSAVLPISSHFPWVSAALEEDPFFYFSGIDPSTLVFFFLLRIIQAKNDPYFSHSKNMQQKCVRTPTIKHEVPLLLSSRGNIRISSFFQTINE